MSNKNDFLVEIGTEELPPKELLKLAEEFSRILRTNIAAETGLKFDPEAYENFATPRRIATLIKNLPDFDLDKEIEKFGPSIAQSYDSNGKPTQAALGFAKSCGVTINEITTKISPNKGECLFFKTKIPGRKTVDILPELVDKTLRALPVKKSMRWGMGDVSFVRPIHWILMLYGTETIKSNIWGIQTGNVTYGHRVHSDGYIRIDNPEQYETKLEAAKVIANYKTRKDKIRQEIAVIAKREQATAVIDENLLDMVTGLVEWPVALLANFKTEFLRVPQECLISAMQDHQKCFALTSNNKLVPKFILISNLVSTDEKTVIRGNELVMHARLADAAFHYDKDLQQSLQSRVENLKTVTYQKKLGSLYDKTERIQQLAAWIAPIVGANVAHTKRAALLCKADLLSSMVYEFPEMQGIMGMYYALHDGEEEAVAHAIEQHYKPSFAQDAVPTGHEGVCVAIADRIDSLVGMFGIGNIPTGEKDPYGSRRQAIAVLRTIILRNINLDLKDLFAQSFKTFNNTIKNPCEELLAFFTERLKARYIEQDLNAKTFAAVAANNISNLVDFDQRIKAVASFQNLPQAENLAAANKRVQNLLAKNSARDIKLNESLCTESAEKELLNAIKQQQQVISPLLSSADYAGVLKSLAALQKPVDNFFEHVMVMVDDEKIRNNRLALLQQLRNMFLEVADVSLL